MTRMALNPGFRLALFATLLIAGCGSVLRPDTFAGTTPAFDPVTFWTGHARSWGVVENRDGSPSAIVTTDCAGTAEGADGVHLVQHVAVSGKDSVREWHMRRLDAHHFAATANDMVGEARGEASGRMFHWTWIWATQSGSDLRNVAMEQWMYLADDGTLMNRTVVTKLGIRLAEVSEQFVREP